jgi:hypothetical protein
VFIVNLLRFYGSWAIDFDRDVFTFYFDITDPQDMLVDRYVDPSNLDTARFVIQQHIYVPLSSLLTNPEYDQSKVKELQEIMGKQFVEFRKATTRTPAEVRPTTDTSVVKPPAKNIAAPKTIVENGGGAAFVNPTGIRRTTPNPGSLSDRVQKENIRRSGLDFG